MKAKTVRELIEELSKLDQDLSVWIEDVEEVDTGIGAMNQWVLYPPEILIDRPSKNEVCYVLVSSNRR
jgi:hypothetical protein